MQYRISRNGQIYGPYTLEELQRYVASGNVLLSDHVKSDEMPEWQSVGQVLGTSSPGGRTAQLAAASYMPGANAWPDPPNLNWALLLLLDVFTCGVFSIVYEIVQLIWLKKVQPRTNAATFYILFLVASLLNSSPMIFGHGIYDRGSLAIRFFSLVFGMATFVFLIAYRFAMRRSLEEHFNLADPVGLTLGPIMTLFFGSLYFQYHFNRINTIKQAVRYRSSIV